MPASFSSFSAFTPPSDPNKAVHRSVSPHIIQQKYPKGQKPMSSLGIHEDMRKALLRRAYALARFPAPEDPRVVGLPPALHRYVGVFRMDTGVARKEQVFEFNTMCFRAMSSVDGDIYTIRQVTNVKSFTEPMKLVKNKKYYYIFTHFVIILLFSEQKINFYYHHKILFNIYLCTFYI